MTASSDRYSPQRWRLPVEELRAGFYSAKYFVRTKEILERTGRSRKVLMQVFQKGENTVACGIDEAIAVLKAAAGAYDGSGEWRCAWDSLTVRALPEGATTRPWETVMTIEGDYTAFAHLESVYLGILADRSGVATKTRRIVEAAAPRDVLFFGDRFKDFRTQSGDGYAAHVGGATSVCTDAHAYAYGGVASGTMPHALIASLDGSTVEAARLFSETFPNVPLVALVDYENDCVETSLACARALGQRLWGVRLDTSEKLVDESLRRDPPADMGGIPLTGVNRHLAERVRGALDAAGFSHVRLIASGGMTPEKVATLKQVVDAFGVGSSLLKGGIDYTADIVMVDGLPQSKIGRGYRPNERLEIVHG